MRWIMFCAILFLLSACSSTPTISTLNETSTEQKIRSNKSIASQAQDEYKKLQEKRREE